MSKFEFKCYDEKNNIIEINDFNKLDCLTYIVHYNPFKNIYDNNGIQFKNDVPPYDIYLYREMDFRYRLDNFIKKVCYYLNKLTKYNDKPEIKNIHKIIFTLDSSKFIINKIESNKNYNIYNINYIENGKEIFNDNIFLYNFDYANMKKIYKIQIPLGDYIYELLENKEYFNKKNELQNKYEQLEEENKKLKNIINKIHELNKRNKQLEEENKQLKDVIKDLVDIIEDLEKELK